MKIRVIAHIVAFVLLAGVGAWIAYQGVVAPIRIGRLDIDIELAAIYWFALLIYAFVCLVLYYPLRRRAWPMLLVGHASAVAIALTGTFIITTLGAQNSSDARAVPSESAQALEEVPPPSDADPDALPLPLPPNRDSP